MQKDDIVDHPLHFHRIVDDPVHGIAPEDLLEIIGEDRQDLDPRFFHDSPGPGVDVRGDRIGRGIDKDPFRDHQVHFVDILLQGQERLRIPVDIESSPDAGRKFGERPETGIDFYRRSAIAFGISSLTRKSAPLIGNFFVDVFTKPPILLDQAVL